tara:strand:+ start:1473 stop:1850 length:378 start_codon:yes stop_codon:yes gene_type:complete
MEELIQLGKTTRSVGTFGVPILTDGSGTVYQYVSAAYRTALNGVERAYREGRMVPLDFKLKRARGRIWPEPPKKHDVLTLFAPKLLTEPMCTAVVQGVWLDPGRSVGLVYLENVVWKHKIVSRFI